MHPNACDTCPALIRPGHRAINGSLCPPSQFWLFQPLNCPAVPPSSRSGIAGPLSLENITSVFPSTPASFTARNTSPTLQSNSSTTSPNNPRLLLPLNFGLAASGQCGNVCAK
ncbi:MAG: hypothetical protein IPJ98_23765 [Bryobacterales bacterium]|nr:hypothetical protein [Bryobacterales bacterium]